MTIGEGSRSGFSRGFRSWFSGNRPALVVLLAASLFYARYEFRRLPEGGDRANWVYMAQTIVRGGVPYRDAVNIKSPLSAYIGAVAILAARPFGVRDLYAVRLAFMLLGICTVVLTYLVAADTFHGVRVGLLAAVILLSFSSVIRGNCSGIQPKTPMILFGLVALWAINRNRPFLAGSSGMLSALSWQPGLLFVGAAGVGFSRYLTRLKDPRVRRLLVGACLPAAALLLYFAWVGGLRPLFEWTFLFNLEVYAGRELRSPEATIGTVFRLARPQWPLVVLAAAGGAWLLRVALARRERKSWTRFLDDAPIHALWISACAYGLFCAINLQGQGDLLPFLPLVSILASFAIVAAVDRLTDILGIALGGTRISQNSRQAVFGCLLVGVAWMAGAGGRNVETGFPALQDQDSDLAEIKKYLDSPDSLYVHGRTEVLTVSGLANADPCFLLDRGKDLYLDRVESGGFEGWFARLKAKRPAVVLLSRLGRVVHREAFLEWVRTDYEVRRGKVFTYYLRRDLSEARLPVGGRR